PNYVRAGAGTACRAGGSRGGHGGSTPANPYGRARTRGRAGRNAEGPVSIADAYGTSLSSGVIVAGAGTAAGSSAWRTRVYAMGGYPGYVPNQYPFHSDDWKRPAAFFQVDKARVAGILPAVTPEVEGGAYAFDSFIVQAINGNESTYGFSAC